MCLVKVGGLDLFHRPPKLIYMRWLGVLCSLIPAVLLGILNLITRFYMTSMSITWVIITFVSLAVFSYPVDIVYLKTPLISRVKIPFLQMALAWAILFPISRFVGDILLYAVTGSATFIEAYQLSVVASSIVFLAILGLVYGLFFYTVYMYFFRLYMIRQLKKRGIKPPPRRRFRP